MAHNEASTAAEHWQALRVEVASLASLLDPPSMNLVELGKAYERVAGAIAAATVAEGRASLRFAACAKALDLRTSKSELEAFVQERP